MAMCDSYVSLPEGNWLNQLVTWRPKTLYASWLIYRKKRYLCELVAGAIWYKLMATELEVEVYQSLGVTTVLYNIYIYIYHGL